jgi:diguanylate cyclase (GGDEF)-like protein
MPYLSEWYQKVEDFLAEVLGDKFGKASEYFNYAAIEDLKNIKSAKKESYSGIGKYWSWDRDAAEPHWGYGKGEEILLIGKITEDSIDIRRTLLQNMNLSEYVEKEITLNYDAKVEIIGAEYNEREYNFNKGVLVKANYTNIWDKFWDLYKDDNFYKDWKKENVDRLLEELERDEQEEGAEKIDRMEYENMWENEVPTFENFDWKVYRIITVKNPLKFIKELIDGKLPYIVSAKENEIKKEINEINPDKVVKDESKGKKVDYWKNLALHDNLTGVYNRNGFEILLKGLEGQDFIYGISDIDHFKKFNDTWGHEFGDEVLKELAQYLDNELIISRFGGEEFVFIAPYDPKHIEEINEYLNEVKEGVKDIKLSKKDAHITISIGYTIFDKNKSIDSIFEEADKAVYCSKSGGRDKVTKYEKGMNCSAHAKNKEGELIKNESCDNKVESKIFINAKGKEISIDLDGTIIISDFPRFGKVIEENVEVMRILKEQGWRIIIFTARMKNNIDKEKINKFLIENDIPFDDITNIKSSRTSIFIDDRAIGVEVDKPWGVDIFDKIDNVIKEHEKIKSNNKIEAGNDVILYPAWWISSSGDVYDVNEGDFTHAEWCIENLNIIDRYKPGATDDIEDMIDSKGDDLDDEDIYEYMYDMGWARVRRYDANGIYLMINFPDISMLDEVQSLIDKRNIQFDKVGLAFQERTQTDVTKQLYEEERFNLVKIFNKYKSGVYGAKQISAKQILEESFKDILDITYKYYPYLKRKDGDCLPITSSIGYAFYELGYEREEIQLANGGVELDYDIWDKVTKQNREDFHHAWLEVGGKPYDFSFDVFKEVYEGEKPNMDNSVDIRSYGMWDSYAGDNWINKKMKNEIKRYLASKYSDRLPKQKVEAKKITAQTILDEGDWGGWWITPDSTIYQVDTHGKWIQDNRDIVEQYLPEDKIKWIYDLNYYNTRGAINALIKIGWTRVRRVRDEIAIDTYNGINRGGIEKLIEQEKLYDKPYKWVLVYGYYGNYKEFDKVENLLEFMQEGVLASKIEASIQDRIKKSGYEIKLYNGKEYGINKIGSDETLYHGVKKDVIDYFKIMLEKEKGKIEGKKIVKDNVTKLKYDRDLFLRYANHVKYMIGNKVDTKTLKKLEWERTILHERCRMNIDELNYADVKIEDPEIANLANVEQMLASEGADDIIKYMLEVVGVNNREYDSIMDLPFHGCEAKVVDKYKIGLRANDVPHKYGCLMVDIPEDIANQIKEITKIIIKEEELYKEEGEDKYGYENEPHITVYYGLSEDSGDNIFKNINPVKIKLGNIIKFEDKDNPYDVVAVEVISEDLNKLHEKIGNNFEHDDTYPNYRPHLTLSYTQKGKCKGLIDKPSTILFPEKSMNVEPKNIECVLTKFIYSNADKKKFEYDIPMKDKIESSQMDSYWIDPNGKEYSMKDDTHYLWIYNNAKLVKKYLSKDEYQLLVSLDPFEEGGNTMDTLSELVDKLIENGWVRVMDRLNVLYYNTNDNLPDNVKGYIGKHTKSGEEITFTNLHYGVANYDKKTFDEIFGRDSSTSVNMNPNEMNNVTELSNMSNLDSVNTFLFDDDLMNQLAEVLQNYGYKKPEDMNELRRQYEGLMNSIEMGEPNHSASNSPFNFDDIDLKQFVGILK